MFLTQWGGYCYLRAPMGLASSGDKFCGFHIGPDGISPSPAKLAAITSFPVPKDRTDLRSFVGLANQLGGFTRNVTEALLPLRQLLSTKRAFLGDSDKQADFERARRLLSSPPSIVPLTPNCQSCSTP